jgi:hypothetical protein
VCTFVSAALSFVAMKLVKRYYAFFLFLLLPVLLVQNIRCAKEYSFEGAIVDTVSTGGGDSVITQIPTTSFPSCNSCNPSNPITLGHWSFKTGNSFQCGTFTNSGFFNGFSKKDFTFFGPSACSIDTGIVVSVYLPVALDRDQYNLTTEQTAFYYYDHNAPADIFQSRSPYVFSVTVQSFIQATGIVTGTFGGTVFAPNGDSAHITEGRFIAPLH